MKISNLKSLRHYLVWAVAISLVAVALLLGLSHYSSSRAQRLRTEADSLYAVAQRQLPTSRFTEAYVSLSGALQRYERLGDLRGITQSRIKLASLFYGMEQFDESRRMLDLARDHVQLAEPSAQMTYYRINAILLTQFEHNYHDAERHMRQALALATSHRDTGKVLADMGNLAEIYVNAGDYARALQVVDSIGLLGAHSSGRMHLPQMLLCKGRALYGLGQSDSAYVSLLQCQSLAHEFNLLNIEVDALQMLSTLDSLYHRQSSYIYHFRGYVALRDTLNGSQATYRLGQLKAQTKVMELRQAEQKRHYLLIIAIVSLALLLTMVLSGGTILYLNYRRSRQNEVIAMQDKELMSQKMHLSELERELLELKLQKGREKLVQTADELDRANKDNLSMSLQLASAQPQGKKSSLQSFDEIFQKVDRHFYEVLLQRHPRITKTEQRLACLIKLRMSSQEIASALNVSSDSLYKMRYRLRKKIGLTPDEDLDNYICSMD